VDAGQPSDHDVNHCRIHERFACPRPSRVPQPHRHPRSEANPGRQRADAGCFFCCTCLYHTLRPPFSVVVTDWLSAWQRAAPSCVLMYGASPFGAHRCATSRSRPAAGDERKDRPSAVAGCREEASARRTHVTGWRRWHAPSRRRNAPDSAPEVEIWMVIPSL
jgi:hypothetical protein